LKPIELWARAGYIFAMTVVTRWWLVRHAPVPGYGGRLYPHEDVDADVSDERRMRQLAALLPQDAVWITSGVRRTEQTADAILAADAPQPAARVSDADLIEQRYGDWAGQRYDDLFSATGQTRDGRTVRFWDAPGEARAPGGESFADVIGRVGPALVRLSNDHAGQNIVAVAHSGSIRAALCHALGAPADRGFSIAIDNLSTSRIDCIRRAGQTPMWRVVFTNLRPDHGAGRS